MNEAQRRHIWLCADDYGISPAVSAAIRELIARRRIPFSQEAAGCRVFLQRAQLDKWLEAAAAHAEAKKFDPAIYLSLRLDDADASSG